MKTLIPILSILALTSPAAAVPIAVFNAGVDESGAVLAGGATDSHWTVVGEGAAKVVSPIPAVWLPNTSVSKWIWQNADGTPTNTTRVLETTFDLTGLDLTTVALAGRWASDDFGTDILINGISILPPNLASSFWAWRRIFRFPTATSCRG